MGTYTLNTYHTLVELAKRTDPKGNSAELINILAERNPMLEEAHWEEANDLNSHEFTQIITEPVPGYGRINKDIPFSAGTARQVVEPIGSIVDAFKIDDRLLAKASNASEYLAKEAKIHIEAMGKAAHKALLYGNRGTDPDAITGFMTRYNSLSDTDSVINGGGSGSDVASILVVKWGRDGAYLAYPKEFGKFIQETGPKQTWVSDSSAGGHYVEIMTWAINLGLCIAKPKNVQRICNLEVTGSSNIFDPDDLVTALDRLDSTDGAVIYVPRKIYTQMNINLMNKSNSYYTREEEWGRPVTKFMGIPVKCCDQMLTTETALS